MCNEQLKQALNKIKKEGIKVVPCCQGFDPSKAMDTRFGGPAFAVEGDKQLICPKCGQPLTFVFQYREHYDKDLKPSGSLFSVYYCFNCVPIGRDCEEDGQWVIAEHPNPDASKFVDGHGNDGKLKPCSCEMKRTFLLPDYETVEGGESPEFQEVDRLCKEIDADDPMSAYEDAAAELGMEVQPATVIGGYPVWLQGEGESVCPVDGCEVDFVTQIDSEEMADLMWGDAGSLYVFRCKKHKAFAIEMQCY